MKNLELYEKVRTVPKTAQREIQAGRLKGKTDINPMWRIKTLTEQFGICGIGWKAPIKRMWTEAGANEETAAFVEIDLFIRVDDKWSEGINGIGGSMLISKEKNGLYTSDECYKMAYTDAISVACKMLGVGADVYWDKDKTKYDRQDEDKPNPQPEQPKQSPKPQNKTEIDLEKVAKYYGVAVSSLTEQMKEMALKQKRKEISLQELEEYKQDLNYDS